MEINSIDQIREEARRVRKDLGWSQNRLAMKAGVSLNTVYRMEHLEYDIYLDTLLRIMRALGMKLVVTQGRC